MSNNKPSIFSELIDSAVDAAKDLARTAIHYLHVFNGWVDSFFGWGAPKTAASPINTSLFGMTDLGHNTDSTGPASKSAIISKEEDDDEYEYDDEADDEDDDLSLDGYATTTHDHYEYDGEIKDALPIDDPFLSSLLSGTKKEDLKIELGKLTPAQLADLAKFENEEYSDSGVDELDDIATDNQTDFGHGEADYQDMTWDGEFDDEQSPDSPLACGAGSVTTEEATMITLYLYDDPNYVNKLIQDLCDSLTIATHYESNNSTALAGRCGSPAIELDSCWGLHSETTC